MKKKPLLLFAAIAIIAACVFVWVAMLPPTPGVTKANFDRIKVGMTYAEVVEIFGEKPTDMRVTRADMQSTVLWQATYSSGYAQVEFQHGRVVEEGFVINSVWLYSNPTLWAKLRRWVGLK